MLTALGKVLRVIRMDRNLLLKDMADMMGVKPSYISSIEHGKRKPSESFIQSVQAALKLSDCELQSVSEAYIETVQQFSLSLNSNKPYQLDLALALARSFESLTCEEADDMKKILNRGNVIEKTRV